MFRTTARDASCFSKRVAGRLRPRSRDRPPPRPVAHSEVGRFHRMIALLLLALSALSLLVEVVRQLAPTETTLLLALLVLISVAGRWLLRDLRVHPANFPPPTDSQGLRLTAGSVDTERQPR